MEGVCQCANRAEHDPVVGKQRSVESGHYPKEMCEANAELVIQHFKRIATSEFYVKRAEDLAKEVDDLKKKGTKRPLDKPPIKEEEAEESSRAIAPSSKSKPQPKKEEDEYTYEYETDEGEDTKAQPVKVEDKADKRTKEWEGGQGRCGMLKESKAKANDPANLKFLEGMRNATETVAGMPEFTELATAHFRGLGKISN